MLAYTMLLALQGRKKGKAAPSLAADVGLGVTLEDVYETRLELGWFLKIRRMTATDVAAKRLLKNQCLQTMY